ncbi:acetylglutamate kinase [Candidatus Methylacidithermus pantelleriae]|uniref:Acetylglutamate kinase n=1 Tax=Candidatus Methylacidithermus pantelleriae TaxID=2744239 RepID=A0A8J2FP06_9BACT|nr:acetylglutamate kinase [Candidatus Methylacidithermus pantelleriae]CAF0699129.1 Acetylglutamate kinase [Candidatus Methylacidithermus pantelleriae]
MSGEMAGNDAVSRPGTVDVLVVKWGGSLQQAPQPYQEVCEVVALGWGVTCVCGGGPAISESMREQGLEVRFHQGLRVTDLATLEVVRKTFSQKILPQTCRKLAELGGRAEAIPGEEIFTAVRQRLSDESTGEELELGWVGEIITVDPSPVWSRLSRRTIPVISPLARGKEAQECYNVNADLAAAHLAAALHAQGLIYLTDVPGVLRKPSEPASSIPWITQEMVEDLLRSGGISGGMIPKLKGGLLALSRGVPIVWLLDGRVPGALQQVLWEGKGPGTRVIP